MDFKGPSDSLSSSQEEINNSENQKTDSMNQFNRATTSISIQNNQTVLVTDGTTSKTFDLDVQSITIEQTGNFVKVGILPTGFPSVGEATIPLANTNISMSYTDGSTSFLVGTSHISPGLLPGTTRRFFIGVDPRGNSFAVKITKSSSQLVIDQGLIGEFSSLTG